MSTGRLQNRRLQAPVTRLQARAGQAEKSVYVTGAGQARQKYSKQQAPAGRLHFLHFA